MTDMVCSYAVKYFIKLLTKKNKVLPHHYFNSMPNGIIFFFLFFFFSLFPLSTESTYKVTGNTENIELVSSIVISYFLLKNYQQISRSWNYKDKSKQNGHNLREDNMHFVDFNGEASKVNKVYSV